MSRLFLSAVVVAAVVATPTSAPASGVTYDKLAYLTFSAPVQVPGATLGAGTYRFRLTNPATSRNVLQVLSRDGSFVYAMFHTIPDSRTAVTDDAIVTFRETPAGVPPALRSLFYGGEYFGYEFVYAAGGPDMAAGIAPEPGIAEEPWPAFADEPVIAAELEPAAPEPAIDEVAEAEPLIEAQPEAAPQAVELPRTASALPLIAAGGLGTLLAGLGIGLLRRSAR